MTTPASGHHNYSLSLGESLPNEEPINPFGMSRLQTAEEELGYRQPFTNKEREFSLHTIQVDYAKSKCSDRNMEV